MSGHDLIPTISIANFVSTREGILSRFEQVQRLLIEADTMAKSAGFGKVVEQLVNGGRGHFGGGIECSTKLRGLLEEGSVGDRMKHVDASGWSHLLSQTGLRTFMDVEARVDWDKQLGAGTMPPLTKDMIAGVFATLNEERQTMTERGVVNLFRALSWDHKTNLPQKFGKKVIVKNVLCYHGWVDERTGSQLDDMTRAMCVFDGKPEPDHRMKIWSVASAGAGTYETEYFFLKVHKKGTAHLTFKRLDLMERLNMILSKHHPNALPAPKPSKKIKSTKEKS